MKDFSKKTKPICGECQGKGGWQEMAEDETLVGWKKCPKCKGTGTKLYDAGNASGYPGRKVSIPED